VSPVQSKHSTQRPKGTFLATVTRRARLALLLVADDAQLGRRAALHAAQRRAAARARARDLSRYRKPGKSMLS